LAHTADLVRVRINGEEIGLRLGESGGTPAFTYRSRGGTPIIYMGRD
jgi:hypothetical protein